MWSRDEVSEEEIVSRIHDWLPAGPVSLNKEPIKGDRLVTGVGPASSRRHLYNVQLEPSRRKLEANDLKLGRERGNNVSH